MYPPQWPTSRAYAFLAETGSTNTEIKNRIRLSCDPVFEVICADRQTAGRGRLGRSFFSPAGGIYFSASFPLCGKERDPAFLSLLAGLAAAETLEKTCGAFVRLKWPNDLYLGEKKLGGILTEYLPDRSTAIVGIGINTALSAAEIPEALQGVMTSLAAERLPIPERALFMRETVALCDRRIYREHALLGNTEPFVKAFNDRAFLTGKHVVREDAGAYVSGVVRRVADDGALEIVRPDGTVKRITYGDVHAATPSAGC